MDIRTLYGSNSGTMSTADCSGAVPADLPALASIIGFINIVSPTYQAYDRIIINPHIPLPLFLQPSTRLCPITQLHSSLHGSGFSCRSPAVTSTLVGTLVTSWQLQLTSTNQPAPFGETGNHQRPHLPLTSNLSRYLTSTALTRTLLIHCCLTDVGGRLWIDSRTRGDTLSAEFVRVC